MVYLMSIHEMEAKGEHVLLGSCSPPKSQENISHNLKWTLFMLIFIEDKLFKIQCMFKSIIG